MSRHCREIITKAVVAKGRKFTKATHRVAPEHKPCSILGCWIINHHFAAKKKGKKVEITGHYDINVWYSYANNTKTEVVTERVNYLEEVNLKYRDTNFFDDNEVLAKVIQQPNCVECLISSDGNGIKVHVEREFLVEVVGETKVVVQVCENGEEDCSWEYDVGDDELADIDPDFLREVRDC